MKEKNITTYIYEENPISFSNAKNIMVNATEMAKPFDKKPANWLELPSTIEFLKTLSDVRKSDIGSLIITHKGGDNKKGNNIQGTWMHRDVAIEFARWLSPAFAIWCNDRIFELIQKGSVSMISALPTNEEKETVKFSFMGYGTFTMTKDERIKHLEDYNSFLYKLIYKIALVYENDIRQMSFEEFTDKINRISITFKKRTAEELKNFLIPVFIRNAYGELVPSEEKLLDGSYSYAEDGTLMISFKEQLACMERLDRAEYHFEQENGTKAPQKDEDETMMKAMMKVMNHVSINE